MASIDIKITLPKTDLTKKKWLDAIASKQRAKSLPTLRALFKQTVFGWSEKPDFGWAQAKSANEITLSVYPTGSAAGKWLLVNAGSPAHEIKAKPGGFLRFRPGYRSATRPGSLQSGRAYRSGKTVGALTVHHPGFEGRNFTGLIAEKFAEDFGMDMQAAITEVANRG